LPLLSSSSVRTRSLGAVWRSPARLLSRTAHSSTSTSSVLCTSTPSPALPKISHRRSTACAPAAMSTPLRRLL